DLVYDALRCRRSFAALGGGMTGRGLILGRARGLGDDVAALFQGAPHSPVPPGPDEVGRPPEGWERLDIPDWLGAAFEQSLGDSAAPVLQALQNRAPVFLRVNAARLSRDDAIRLLAGQGIVGEPHALAETAIRVTGGTRRIQTSAAYLDGGVELQDAASQAVVAQLPLRQGDRILDLCAGGGGKTLAIAARLPVAVFAHDAVPGRMTDLVARAARAGTAITLTDRPETTAPYDLVLTDVPCSGSGSWRRDPEGKWRLTPARLQDLCSLQAQILDRAAGMVGQGGYLAYVTCSVLRAENDDQIAALLTRDPRWTVEKRRQFTPLEGGDGFFLAVMRRV
ncbi:MAG: RsmB/NOP family class I SAM-dependent RNA methyltransferase, partial [Pseudomonadota bacterium]